MENLKELRKSKGLTQKEVAQEAGIALSSYQSYERGERSPRVETLGKILSVLGQKSAFQPNRTTLDDINELEDYFFEEIHKETEKRLSVEGFVESPAYHDYLVEFTEKALTAAESLEKIKLHAKLDMLNAEGLDKARDYIELLLKLPEYVSEKEKPNNKNESIPAPSDQPDETGL